MKDRRLKHGMARKCSEYTIWCSMKRRCQAPKHSSYARYGGRGIQVCESWQKFENFYKDMGPRPSKDFTLERINNDGNYCPSNVRWAHWREQYLNKQSRRSPLQTPCKSKLGVRGVQWIPKTGKYQAKHAYKVIGTYSNIVDAAKAYNEIAIKCHGEYACLNDIDELIATALANKQDISSRILDMKF